VSMLHSFLDGVFDFAGMGTALEELLTALNDLPTDEFGEKVEKMGAPMRLLALAAVRAEITSSPRTPERLEKLARLESVLDTD
jgi:hypothetical protein